MIPSTTRTRSPYETDLVTVLTLESAADYRWLLRRALQRDGGFDIVGEVSHDQEALELAARHHPQLIVVDHSPVVPQRLETLAQLRRICPMSQIVVLGASLSPAAYDAAIAAGAAAVVRKGSSLTHVVKQFRLTLGYAA